jgi:signal peptide peptidase SppA
MTNNKQKPDDTVVDTTFDSNDSDNKVNSDADVVVIESEDSKSDTSAGDIDKKDVKNCYISGICNIFLIIKKIICLIFGLFFRCCTDNKVAVLKLSGVIADDKLRRGINYDSLDPFLIKAFNPKKYCAVVLLVNSPGGSPVQADMISQRIKALATENKIRVYAFAEDYAASGGYYIMCCANELYASAHSIIGSIGVVSRGFGLENAIDKLGIKRRVYSVGKNKSVLDPFTAVKDNDVKMINDIQTDIYDVFVSHVKTNRVNKLKNDIDLFDGTIWSGKKALELGLVDGLGYYYQILIEKFGSKTKFVKLNNNSRSVLSKLLFALKRNHLDDLLTRVENVIHRWIIMNKN